MADDSWLPDLLGVQELITGTTGAIVLPQRKRLWLADGITAEDDPTTKSTKLSVASGSGGSGGGSVSLPGTVAYADLLTGVNNNIFPSPDPENSTALVVTAVAGAQLAGLHAPVVSADPYHLRFINASAVSVDLLHEASSSDAENRLHCFSGATVSVPAGGAKDLVWYPASYSPGGIARWYVYGDAAPAAAGPSVVVTDSATVTGVFAADVGKYHRLTATTSKTIAVGTDAMEPLPANYEKTYDNDGAGDATFVPAVGVTIKPPYGGSLVVPPNGVVTLKRLALNTFRLVGTTVPAP